MVSKILATVRKSIGGLYNHGIVSSSVMKKFNQMCAEKKTSTFDRKMQDPEFKKEFDVKYDEFLKDEQRETSDQVKSDKGKK